MTTALLSCAGRPVGRYSYGPDTDGRPYLHPVTTLAGTPVTEERPADHIHHLGASVAVPDVAGRNFWGGRTYVRDQGPTVLDNHGTQRHLGWKLRDPDGFVEELSWEADGTELLREHRTVAVAEVSGTAWALDFSFSLTNRGGADLSIGSPATNGRPGAGYGGFFWRAPKEPPHPPCSAEPTTARKRCTAGPPTGLPSPGTAGRWSSPGRPTRPGATPGSCGPRSTPASDPPSPRTAG